MSAVISLWLMVEVFLDEEASQEVMLSSSECHEAHSEAAERTNSAVIGDQAESRV